MNRKITEELIKIAQKEIKREDISHDFGHTLRVLKLAKLIAKEENADLDIIVPAALFHDIIVYPKDDKRSKLSTNESAVCAGKILKKIEGFPAGKITKVQHAIQYHSFSQRNNTKILEDLILQDADRLEATGAIAIMRTFASAGQMGKSFYNLKDPFCNNRKPQSMTYSLDLFYDRLLLVCNQMYTQKAKILAKERTVFLHKFIRELKKELAF